LKDKLYVNKINLVCEQTNKQKTECFAIYTEYEQYKYTKWIQKTSLKPKCLKSSHSWTVGIFYSTDSSQVAMHVYAMCIAVAVANGHISCLCQSIIMSNVSV
jgi:hypothetical protein